MPMPSCVGLSGRGVEGYSVASDLSLDLLDIFGGQFDFFFLAGRRRRLFLSLFGLLFLNGLFFFFRLLLFGCLFFLQVLRLISLFRAKEPALLRNRHHYAPIHLDSHRQPATPQEHFSNHD